MKKLPILLLLLSPWMILAQKKPPKPSLSKAERTLREGKFDLSRQIIDITVASEKFASNPKAWYIRGVVYAGIDTSSDETIKKGISDPFAIAKQSFEKYTTLQDEKRAIYLTDNLGLPRLPEQINASFAQRYFEIGLKQYQDDKDYKASFKNVSKALFFIPQDTAVLLNTGLFFAPSAEEYKQAITHLKKYIELGGTSIDAYIMLFSIYRDNLQEDEKALAIVKEAMEKYPQDTNFPKYELDMYIKMNKLEEARRVMEKQAEDNPNDAETRYYLGVVNQELKDDQQALTWYRKALEIKPDYLEACTAVAEIMFIKAKGIKKEMNALGISKEDQKKRFALDKQLVKELNQVLPYWVACEKINEKDSKVLDNLLTIYNNLGLESEAKRIKKKMKDLGIY